MTLLDESDPAGSGRPRRWRRTRLLRVAGTIEIAGAAVLLCVGGWQVWQGVQPAMIPTRYSDCHALPPEPTQPDALVETCTETWLGDGHTRVQTIYNFTGKSLEGAKGEEPDPRVEQARESRPSTILQLVQGFMLLLLGGLSFRAAARQGRSVADRPRANSTA